MKKLFLATLMSIFTMVSAQADGTNVEMCKSFINKAKAYQSTMKEDSLSQATLAFYKDEVVNHCGNIAAKMPYEKNFFANVLMKQENTSVNNCKLSIKMAQAYAETEEKSFLMTHAHKVNVVDNCGTLMAKKAPVFCLFDVVDNTSKEDIKERCIASIRDAHAFQKKINLNPEALQAHKDAVVANCGQLQAAL
jgi:hypothetical protein